MKKINILILLFFFGIVSYACPTPTNLNAIIEENVPGYTYRFKVTVSWDAVEDAESYAVYVNGSLFGYSTTNFYIAGSDYETTVTFAVQTNCTDDTSSEISEPLTVVVAPQNDCLAPTNLNAEVEEDVQGYEYMYRVTLTWDQVNNANSYSVYINDDYIQDVNTNSYVVGFDYNITIVFNVSSNCDDGESDLSEPLEVVLGAPCLPPTNLNATVQQDLPEYEYMYKVTLTWDPVDNANSYTVYENNEWKGYATENTYEIGYNEETTVIYTVTSSCELGESEHSEPITVIIQNDAINEYENLFDIYPNPVDNHLIIKTQENIEEISIYNIVGLCVYHEISNISEIIDMSSLSSGTYFVEIKTDKGEIIKRIIKK